MKKLFPLHDERKNTDRVVDALKHEVRKYLKRERAKKVPEGFDFWEFDCKFGKSAQTAQSVHHADLNKEVDKAHEAKWNECYVEIIAVPAKKPVAPANVEETK